MKKGKRMLALLIGLLMIVNLFGVTNPTEAYADTHDHTTLEETDLSDTATLRATKAAGDTVLAFSSDVHNTSDNTAANRIGKMIDIITSEKGAIDTFGFCGDMGSASANESQFWTYTQSVMDVVANKGVTGAYTTGNHEFYNGQYASTSNSVKSKYKVGEILVNGDNYVMYGLGTDNWNNSSDNYTTGQVTSLTNFLNSASLDKPVFVLTHFPLHRYSSRSTTNADKVIDALNAGAARGLKIVLLWGHNHTMSDTNYDQIFEPGDTITYNSSGGTKKIQFFYGAAGCGSDSEYGSGSAYVKGKALAVTINSKDQLSFTYYDANGNNVTEGGTYTEQDPVYATGITLSDSAITLEQGRSKKLTVAGYTPADTNQYGVTWSSSNNAIATVDSATGRVKAIGSSGTAVITATYAFDSSVKATCTVTVTPKTSTELQYVIKVGNYYMSTEHSSDESTGSSGSGWGGWGSSSSYKGLKAVSLTSAEAADDTTRWIIEEADTGNGYYIKTLDGQYLKAIYATTGSSSSWGGSSSYDADLFLTDDPEDVWVLDNNMDLDAWEINGSYLKSTNASTGQSSDKYLAEETGTAGTHLITVRSRDNADQTSVEQAGDPVAVTGLTLAPTTATVEARKNVQLTASVTPSDATNKTVIWTSSNEGVAKVDSTGKVRGVAEGTAIITATTEEGGFSKTCTVTVTPSTSTVTTYAIVIDGYAMTTDRSPNTANGGSSSYTYTGLAGVAFTNATDVDDNARWVIEETDGGYYIMDTEGNYLSATYESGSSSGKGDLKVGTTKDIWVLDSGYSLEDGTVNGSHLKSTNASNTATSAKYLSYEDSANLFSVRSLDNSDTVTIEEAGDPVAVTGVTVSPATASVEARKTVQLTATVLPTNASNKKVTWSSSNTSVATVDENGKVRGVAEGTAVITVKTADGNKTATANITVTPATSTETHYVIVIDGYAMTAERSPNTANGGSSSYTYTGLAGVAFTSAAEADDNARWIITETNGGYYIQDLEGNYLNATYTSGSNSGKGDLKLDSTKDVWVLDSGYSLEDGTVNGSHFKSTNASATATSDKYLSYENSANLFSVRSLDNSDTVTIEEASDPVAVTGVTVNPTSGSIEVRKTQQLSATVSPSNATNKKVTWSSSNTSVATVDENGKVTGKGEGTAIITVTTVDGGKTATATINVIPSTATQDYYIIVASNHALSSVRSSDTLVNTGSSSSQKYNYTGLAGVSYKSGDEADDTILWIIEETDGGFYIKTPDGLYLNATYESNSTGGYDGDLKVDSTPDVWSLDSGVTLESWEVNASYLKSTNAYGGSNGAKYLGYEDGNGNNFFTVRSQSNADTTTVVEEEGTPSTVTYTWAGWTWTGSDADGYTASGKYNGSNGTSVSILATMTVTETAATCNAEGSKVYKADISASTALDKTARTDSKTVILPKTDHTYGQPSWTWTGNDTTGYTAASAKFTCAVCGDVQNVNATVAASTTGNVTTYTATAQFNGQTYTDTKTVTAVITTYTFTGFTWTGNDETGYTAALANYSISTGGTATANATVTKTVTAADCETAGKTVYTASVAAANSLDETAHSEDKTVVIPATGHKYSAPAWTWTGYGKAVAAFTCENNAAHKQSLDAVITSQTTEPTCTEAGETVYTAKVTLDGTEYTDVRTETLQALGHQWDDGVITTEPTCLTTGIKTITCTVCHETKTEVVPVGDHSYGNLIAEVPATCVETGMKAHYECSVCGKLFDEEKKETTAAALEIATTDHVLTPHDEVAATCTEDGTLRKYWSCELCGKLFAGSAATIELTPEQVFQPALGHDWKFDKEEWVLSENGNSLNVCYICQHDSSHTEKITVPVQANSQDATCTVGGHVTYSASISKEEALDGVAQTFETENFGQPLGHNYGEVTYTWSADNKTLTASHTCSRCGNVESETVNVTAEVTKQPTCTEKGETTYTSAAFEIKAFKVQTKTLEDVAATGHKLTKHSAVAATCASAGSTTYWSCDNCGKFFNDAAGVEEIAENSWVIEKLEHAFGEWTVTKDATCTEAGEKTRTCSNCGEKQTEVIEATGHVLTPHVAAAATCTEAGNSAYWSCEKCSKFFSDAEGKTAIEANSWVIQALGHSYGEWTVTLAATCTTAGEESRTCSRCGATETRPIEATGHKWTFVDITWNRGLTAVANYKCANCNETMTVNATVTSATTAEPDCTTEGVLTYTASVKAADSPDGKAHEATTTEAIEATGHTLTAHKAVEAVCGKDGNSAYWSCEKCGKFFSDAEGKTEIAKDSWVIPALGEHSWSEWTVTKEATCDKAGEESRTCSVCGEVETRAIEAAGHEYIFVNFTWTGNATDGYKAKANYKCEVCGGTKTVTATVSSKTVEPTCAKAGTVTYTATVTAAKSLDGAKHTATKKVAGDPATGKHSYGEYLLTKAAKNTASGLLTKTCSVCGKEVTMVVNPLIAKGVSSTGTEVKITWLKVKGAERYRVYVTACKDSGSKLVGTTTELTFTKSDLKKNTYYNFQVIAQRKIGGKWKTISTSYLGHFISGNTNAKKTFTNAKSITVSASTATVTKGKTYNIVKKLTPKTVLAKTASTYKILGSDHAKEFRYTTTDSSIATVTTDGVITGVKAGTCTIYIVSVNGVYKAIKVTVK